MYNGIGLTSTRGSGTNGYVQRNLAHVSRQKTARAKAVDKAPDDLKGNLKTAKANSDILDHNRKREVEVKVLRLRVALEEQDVPEEEIEARCEKLRAEQLAKLPKPSAGGGGGGGAGGRAGETHTDAEAKEREAAQLKSALGISSSYVSSCAIMRCITSTSSSHATIISCSKTKSDTTRCLLWMSRWCRLALSALHPCPRRPYRY